MKILTSRFSCKIPKNYIAVGIAVGVPKWPLPYECEHYRKLAPFGLFNKCVGEEFRQKYFKRLDGIGVDEIRNKLGEISKMHDNNDVVLLCWEDVRKGQACHRRYFAEWWEG